MSAAVIKTLEHRGGLLRLVFKFGSLRLAEQATGKTVSELFGDGDKLGFTAISALFWAVLQPHHKMTREASDDLVDEIGFDRVAQVLAEGLVEYFGAEAEPGSDEGFEGNARPPKKAARKKSRK